MRGSQTHLGLKSDQILIGLLDSVSTMDLH